MNDNTVTNNPPINVTAHNGIDSKKPHDSTASIIELGRTVLDIPPKPLEVIIVLITPWQILNIANIKSNP